MRIYFLPVMMLLILLISSSFANLVFKKDGGESFEILPNGSILFSNGYLENQTPPSSIEAGQLGFKNGSTVDVWTRSSDGKLCLGRYYNKNQKTPVPGSLRFYNGADYRAEISTFGDLNAYDGAFSLTVEEIHFNWITWKSADDAMCIRVGASTNIVAPEYRRGVVSLPAAYIAGRPSVSIKAKFRVYPESVSSLNIQGISNDVSGCLGSTNLISVNFQDGISQLVSFDVGRTPGCVRYGSDAWDWHVDGIQVDRTTHKIFTVLNQPQFPWINDYWHPNSPWSSVLEYACKWADGATDEETICKKITVGAFDNFPVQYDMGTKYTVGTHCKLSHMLVGGYSDCRDMSAVFQLFTQILGITDVQVRMINGKIEYKEILPIDNFDDRHTWGWISNSWDFHQIGWYKDKVYDACVKLRHKDQNGNWIERYPAGEDINTYKEDLFKSGNFTPETPFKILTIE